MFQTKRSLTKRCGYTKIYVRGDDDDDDEIKTSMFVRVYHISNWPCGFDVLNSDLKNRPHGMADNNEWALRILTNFPNYC